MRALLPLFALACTPKGDDTAASPDDCATGARSVEDCLASAPGVQSVSLLDPTTADSTLYLLLFEQPVDHEDPDGPTFLQQVSVLHRGFDAPTVLLTQGYAMDYPGWEEELTTVFSANQVEVEHRFFGASLPDPDDWSTLDSVQAAADHHAVVEALRPLYTGPWLSSGVSKSGEAALYHHAQYPDDVDATVAYVAPILTGLPDTRFAPFFETVGTAACRDRLIAIQRALLADPAARMPVFLEEADSWGETYTLVPPETALQISVAELSWVFWQYDGDCAALPETDDPDELLRWMYNWIGSPDFYSDNILPYYEPYFYQCAAESGYPEMALDPIADLLTADPADLSQYLTRPQPAYAPAQVEADAAALTAGGERLILIYGADDPWTVGALPLGGDSDALSFTISGANHGALIDQATAADQEAIYAALARWTGLERPAATARQSPGVPSRRAPLLGPRRRWAL